MRGVAGWERLKSRWRDGWVSDGGGGVSGKIGVSLWALGNSRGFKMGLSLAQIEKLFT